MRSAPAAAGRSEGASSAGRRRPAPAGSGLLAHRAYQAVKGQILTMQLPPGRRILVHDLADELGMSVTPVHEALKRLCAERLVEVILRTGYVVAPVTLTDVQEIFEMRLALEPLAADRAVRRAGDRDLAAFRDTVYARPSHEMSGSPEAAGDHHDRFHLAVAELSGQRRLVDSIRDLLDQSRRLMLMSYAPSPAVEAEDLTPGRPGPLGGHQLIADAVLARDRPAAVAAMADHVRRVHRRVTKIMTHIPADPFVDDGGVRSLA